MTLKSLNTRYLKLIRKMAAAVVLLLATVSLLSLTRWSAEATEFILRPAEADNSIPSLQPVAAVSSTNVDGAYDAQSSGHAARSQHDDYNGQGPLFMDEQKLTASDGAADLAFGWSVAFSGSTVVVGAI